VTAVSRRQKPAPSIAAASYRSVGTFCRPAIRHRNANGQDRHTDATTTATRLLGPISQNGGLATRGNWAARTGLTSPAARWDRNVEVMIAAKTGNAYGVRKSARSTARPRNGRCRNTAPARPSVHDSPTEITV